jgi:hypothetical protein
MLTGTAERAATLLLRSGVPLFIMAGACVCTRTQDKKTGEEGPNISSAVLEAAKAFNLDDDKAKKDLEVFTQQVHPFGSDRNAAVADYLIERTGQEVASVKTAKQTFTATVPNPAAENATGPVATTLERTGQNVIATGTLKPDADCIILFGSHYDSKDIAGISYVGANDSGSSSVALLHILGFISSQRDKFGSGCDVGAVWFDGEEAVLENWNDGLRSHPARIQDNTYGSRHFVSQLSPCDRLETRLRCMPEDLGGKAVVALVLLDMIGSPDIQISRDLNSSVSLLKVLESATRALDMPHVLNPATTSIEDDHIPFRRAGIAALDIIDFNNIAYWHAAGDDLDKISFESIELASRLAIFTGLTVSQDSKVFAQTTE